MNDRYLFRGKRVDNGEWVTGFYVNAADHIIIFEKVDEDGDMRYADVDLETVGRCTGLEDKNGKLIFEGDIVKMYFGTYCANIVEILYDDEKCAFIMRFFDDDKEMYFEELYEVREIIGNVHDNLELLERT